MVLLPHRIGGCCPAAEIAAERDGVVIRGEKNW